MWSPLCDVYSPKAEEKRKENIILEDLLNIVLTQEILDSANAKNGEDSTETIKIIELMSYKQQEELKERFKNYFSKNK